MHLPSPTRTRRARALLGVLAVSLLALAACGGDDDASEAAPTAEAPAEGEAASSGTRAVEHAFGTTDVPTDPERIAVVGRRGTLPILLDLGFEPIAALDASFILGQPFHPLITERTDEIGVEPIAMADTGPNLEQVAALRPDLIIGAAIDISDVADPLAEIAPTVGIEWDFEDPLANVLAVGEAMGRGEEAAELVADFEAEVDAVAAGIEDPGTVSIMGLFAPDDLRVYRSGNFVGQLVERLGGEVVPTEAELPVDPEDPIINDVSLEQLELLRGDRLISFVNVGEELRSAYRAIEAEPVVQGLPAFRTGQVLEVDPQLVFGTAGVTGLRELLGQLEAFFAG